MKKHLLGLAVLGTLGLAGCGGDGPAEPTESPLPPGVALTKAVFESSDSDADGYTIPLPNDLLFAPTSCAGTPQPNTDLTLNIPCVSDANIPSTLAEVGAQSTDPTAGTKRGQAALSKLDGWSTVAPFVVKFKNATTSVHLDEGSLVAGSTVRMFEVSVNAAEVAPGIPGPTGPVTGVVGDELTADDFAVELAPEDSAQMTVRVLPKKPLKFHTTYLVVYTNGIKDSNGLSVVPDSAYGVAKNTTPLPSNNAAYALQQFVNAQEGVAASEGIARESIVLSHHFTTQSRSVMTVGVPGVLSTPQVQAVVTGVGSPATKPTFAVFPVGHPYAGAPVAVPFNNLTAAPGADRVEVRFGELTVPYFSKPTTAALHPVTGLSVDPGPVLESWKSSDTIPGSATTNPFKPNTNYAIPVPKLQGAWAVPGFERIPVLLMTPSSASGCTKPTAGWPVAIFQHGFTGNRTNALGISIALNSACTAVIAIDQPLHGIAASNAINQGIAGATGFTMFKGYTPGTTRERTFGLDLQNNTTGALFSPDGQPDDSGAWFINLYSLLSARDNFRQAAVDLMALKLAIPAMDYDSDGNATSVDFDGSKVRFIGQSLGGIAGTTFSALDQLYAGANSVYPGAKLKASVLNVPGGGLAKMADGSMALGPRFRAGLAGGGVVSGTPGYETFMWLAQTLLDQGDPLNYADILAGATTYPVLMQEVVGTGATYPMYESATAPFIPSDMVVPNATVKGRIAVNPATGAEYIVHTGGPLAGTEPLLANIGLTPTITPVTSPSATPLRVATRFATGHHSVLLSLDANGDGSDSALETAVFGPARVEMQTQAVNFLVSHGRLLPITGIGTIVRP